MSEKKYAAFSPRFFDKIEKMAKEENISVPELLDRALNAEKFFLAQRQQNNKVVVVEHDGKMKEVKLVASA